MWARLWGQHSAQASVPPGVLAGEKRIGPSDFSDTAQGGKEHAETKPSEAEDTATRQNDSGRKSTTAQQPLQPRWVATHRPKEAQRKDRGNVSSWKRTHLCVRFLE